ncbi:MAG: DUF87 domain-containing protein [Deltaproteobacteria bacterium]|nr:DUF87 domain-containing protein [Deltaproteobacteria bacterium]
MRPEKSPEEILEKLKPIIGSKADKLRQLYLLEDYKGRPKIEEIINQARIKHLNEQEILLPPPNNLNGDYPIAEIIYNGENTQTYKLKKKDLTRHVAIFGTTGSGKTNACFYLIGNLIHDNIPFIIADFKQNYRDLIGTRAGKNIKLYTVGKDISPFHFNPLIPPKGADPKTYINKLIDVINHSHFVSYGVDHLLQTAIDQVYKECGVYDGHTRKSPTFKDVLEKIRDKPLKGRESLWQASAVRTLQDLSFGPVGDVFNTERTLNIETFLNEQIVLELDALPQTTKTFLVETLLLQIYLYRINHSTRDEELKHMLILEEAHHLLLQPQGQHSETITDIFLREIRETGQGVCLLDQSPAKINSTALSNVNTLIAMQLRHQDDIQQISKALLIKEYEYFGMLKTGEAIIKTQAPQAFLARFPLAGIKKGTVTNQQIREHMGTPQIPQAHHSHQVPPKPQTAPIIQIAESPGFSSDSPPNTPPKIEPSKNKPLRKSDKYTDEETEFLKDVNQHPLSGVSTRYKRLNWSVDKGNNIKNRLIDNHTLKPVRIPTKTGKLLLLELTVYGRKSTEGWFPKTSHHRIGGVEHEYWRMKAANYYKEQGYKIYYEYPLEGGKTVDLVAEKDGQKTAIEIETGKSNAEENIKKCIDSKQFEKVVCVATNEKVEKQVRMSLKNERLKESKVVVVGCKGYSGF